MAIHNVRHTCNKRVEYVEFTSPIHFSVSTEKPPFFDLACEIGLEKNNRYRIAAVIYQKGRVISHGWNQPTKTHPMQARYKNRAERVFMHAEIHALVRARQDLSGCSITIGRAHKNGLTFGDTRPCNGCRDAIKDEGIRAVNYYYGGRFETEYF